MHRDSTPEIVDLVLSIDNIFAEYDRGIFDDNELITELFSLVNNISMSVEFGDDDCHEGTSPKQVAYSEHSPLVEARIAFA